MLVVFVSATGAESAVVGESADGVGTGTTIPDTVVGVVGGATAAED